jgi:hypothetical protein
VDTPNRLFTRRSLAAILLGFSGLATLTLFLGITAFDQAPGQPATSPPRWPAATKLKHFGGEAELLVFVHPLCNCTNATIAELAKFNARRRQVKAPSITFIVYRPDRNSGWDEKSFVASAAALPNARTLWDDGGEEAARFGARTSGYVLLYSAEGDLVFRGGITGARGHEGDNYGLDALVAALASPHASGPLRKNPVFGCALGSWDAPVTVNKQGRLALAPAQGGRLL